MDIVSKAGASIASSLMKSFSISVIERWSRYRAELFFEEFQSCLLQKRITSDENHDIAKEIDELLSTDFGSEILFDSYRRVSLARSKDIGPRIIGLLTAEICLEGREANDFEELAFTVAETLNDGELLESLQTINEWLATANCDCSQHKCADSSYIENDELKYVVDQDEIGDISHGENFDIDLSIDNLYEEYGSGIQKLKSLGVLTSRVQQSTFSYTEDSERHIDYDGTAQITLKIIVFPLRYRRLLTLIEQTSRENKL